MRALRLQTDRVVKVAPGVGMTAQARIIVQRYLRGVEALEEKQ